jgi:hypothetical protein
LQPRYYIGHSSRPFPFFRNYLQRNQAIHPITVYTFRPPRIRLLIVKQVEKSNLLTTQSIQLQACASRLRKVHSSTHTIFQLQFNFPDR